MGECWRVWRTACLSQGWNSYVLLQGLPWKRLNGAWLSTGICCLIRGFFVHLSLLRSVASKVQIHVQKKKSCRDPLIVWRYVTAAVTFLSAEQRKVQCPLLDNIRAIYWHEHYKPLLCETQGMSQPLVYWQTKKEGSALSVLWPLSEQIVMGFGRGDWNMYLKNVYWV